MSTQFLSKLSQNYIELLKDDKYYDVTIEVGEDPNVKIFRAHMNILCYRSPYLQRNLASNKRNNDNFLVHIKLPNISPEIFQIILEYIYGGILSLDGQDTLDFLKILIVDSGIVSTISSWIDKTVDKKFANVNEYKFELLLRGSRDGFTPKKFHELCDGKHNTITFIKIRGTEEIIGGYNPLKWESPNRGTWSKTKESFIFSFKDKNIKDAIISNVKYEEYAILYNSTVGPYFGSDIIIGAYSESVDYTNSWCRKCYYEKEIRETPDKFSMEDYEVFQIKKQ
ncbi:uncharacterized protein OCT59_028796 [Rhizophagus irregularis]|uniref:uncharacterized protein n=1 Tax=Rhizophagus irregularis TaxID=588596 RepID=UPI00331D31CF|nr:hypothetical protein OCT59_028796 [Rhizophagus irregularis]